MNLIVVKFLIEIVNRLTVLKKKKNQDLIFLPYPTVLVKTSMCQEIKYRNNKKWLLLCRLKCSEPELPSSTGVTSFILRLSFPSCSTAAGSSPSLLSSTEISLAAIVVSLVTSASDGSENEVISAKHQKGMKKTKTQQEHGSQEGGVCSISSAY